MRKWIILLLTSVGIISTNIAIFEAVQIEKARRSNVAKDENGAVKRKDFKYSSKK